MPCQNVPTLDITVEGQAVGHQDLPNTKYNKQVRLFLGYYIPNFTTITVPLTDLIRQSEPDMVVWTTRSFEQLNEMMISQPGIWNPDITQPFVLQTDAPGYGVGAVLSQYDMITQWHNLAISCLASRIILQLRNV